MYVCMYVCMCVLRQSGIQYTLFDDGVLVGGTKQRFLGRLLASGKERFVLLITPCGLILRVTLGVFELQTPFRPLQRSSYMPGLILDLRRSDIALHVCMYVCIILVCMATFGFVAVGGVEVYDTLELMNVLFSCLACL